MERRVESELVSGDNSKKDFFFYNDTCSSTVRDREKGRNTLGIVVPDLDISVVKKMNKESFIERHEIEEMKSLVCSEEQLSEFIKEVASGRKMPGEDKVLDMSRGDYDEEVENRRRYEQGDFVVEESESCSLGNNVLEMIQLQDYEGVFTMFDTVSQGSGRVTFGGIKKIVRDLKRSQKYSERFRDKKIARRDEIPKGLIMRHRVPRVEKSGHERFIEVMRDERDHIDYNDYRENKPARKLYPSSVHAYVARDIMKVRRYAHDDCMDSEGNKPDSNPKFIAVKMTKPHHNRQKCISHREDYEGFSVREETPRGGMMEFSEKESSRMKVYPKGKLRLGLHQDYEYAEDPMGERFFEFHKLRKYDYNDPPKIVNKMDFPPDQRENIIEDRYTYRARKIQSLWKVYFFRQLVLKVSKMNTKLEKVGQKIKQRSRTRSKTPSRNYKPPQDMSLWILKDYRFDYLKRSNLKKLTNDQQKWTLEKWRKFYKQSSKIKNSLPPKRVKTIISDDDLDIVEDANSSEEVEDLQETAEEKSARMIQKNWRNKKFIAVVTKIGKDILAAKKMSEGAELGKRRRTRSERSITGSNLTLNAGDKEPAEELNSPLKTSIMSTESKRQRRQITNLEKNTAARTIQKFYRTKFFLDYVRKIGRMQLQVKLMSHPQNKKSLEDVISKEEIQGIRDEVKRREERKVEIRAILFIQKFWKNYYFLKKLRWIGRIQLEAKRMEEMASQKMRSRRNRAGRQRQR